MDPNRLKIESVEKIHHKGIHKLLCESFPGKSIHEIKRQFEYLNYTNPVQKFEPLGLVAILDEEIISYKGFIALPYLCGEEKIKILVTNTAATLLEYRRQGVSRLINERSLDLYSENYTCFLSTSLNRLSVKGKLRQNWLVLCEKDYLIRTNYLIKNLSTASAEEIFFTEHVPVGSIVDIFKNSIIADDLKIRIDLTSTEFVQWIFNRDQYSYAILSKNKEHIAYCCFKIINGKCDIIHFDMKYSDMSIFSLLKAIGNKYKFRLFSFYSIKHDSKRVKILKKLGFFSTNYVFLRKFLGKELFPIMIRPTTKDVKERSLEIEDLNLGSVSQWDMTKLNNF